MPVFKRDREEQQQNSRERVVSEAKKRIYKQAGLALTAILVTVALLFAMSTAWYSNVLEAGSLTFQAEKWELNADHVSSNGNVVAQPGARGILPVSYKNTSDSIVNAYVNVSKEQMDVPLQKRIYFYTETPYTVERKANSEGESNKETVARRYLTNSTAAPYTVLSMGQLTMSDDFCTVDTPICWEWVYDLLGYYVRLEPTDDGSVIEKEYLRPIVYDYDKATFDENGNLATVDGELSAELFMENICKADGYLNIFTADKKTYTDATNNTTTTYYVVDNTDENTLGYYTAIRLLTKQEIAEANLWDTEHAGASFNNVKITITGETANVDMINVGTTEDLTKALKSENGGYIRLSGNLELTENITVSAKEPVILDLNGATLTGSATGGDLFTVGKGRELTVINGTIKNSAGNKTLFGINNGKLTVSNVTATAEGESQWGIYIQDNNRTTAQDGDSIVYITHSTISTGQPTVMVIGNNTTTAQKTRCVIENSTLTSGYVTVCGNGQTVSGGTAIEIKDSIITGNYAAVYHPQDNSTLHAENSTFTGNTGIAVKGGTVYLDNCVVTGSATATLAGAFNNNGFTDTGAAVYLEAGYERDNIAVYITGENSRITADAKQQQALLLYHDAKDTKTRKARIAISGGTYSSDVKVYLADAHFQSTPNEDGTYTVTRKEAQSGS